MKPTEISKRHWWWFNFYFLLEHFIGLKLSEKYLSKRRKKLYHQISKSENIEGRGGIIPIDIIDCSKEHYQLPSISELKNKPFLFKGAAADWSCMSKWNEDFFKNTLGDYSLNFEYDLGFSNEGKVNHNTDLVSFIKDMKQDKSRYLRFCKIIEDRPELKADLDIEFLRYFKQGDGIEEYFFFMGEANTHTGLHSEVTESITIQIHGEKKWILFAPEERIFFNPVAKRYNHFLTYVNPENADENEYPLFRYAKRYEVILAPGDILWFPAFYWHYVRNISSSIGVAYKNFHLNQAIGRSKMLTILFFLRTHPNIVNPFPTLVNMIKQKIFRLTS